MNLIASENTDVTSQFLRYHPRYKNQYIQNDIDPRNWCCIQSQNCDLYRIMRKIDDCSYYQPPIIGT